MATIDLTKYKNLYVRTAHDYLAKLEQGVSVLRVEPTNQQLMEELHIAAHSLKGQSLAMGYTTTGNVSMTLEHIFRDAKLKPEIISTLGTVIQKSIAALKASIEQIEKDGHEANLDALVQEIKSLYPSV